MTALRFNDLTAFQRGVARRRSRSRCLSGLGATWDELELQADTLEAQATPGNPARQVLLQQASVLRQRAGSLRDQAGYSKSKSEATSFAPQSSEVPSARQASAPVPQPSGELVFEGGSKGAAIQPYQWSSERTPRASAISSTSPVELVMRPSGGYQPIPLSTGARVTAGAALAIGLAGLVLLGIFYSMKD